MLIRNRAPMRAQTTAPISSSSASVKDRRGSHSPTSVSAAPVQISAYDLSFEFKVAHAGGGGGGGGGGGW
jgi:hypothetical protein